MYFLATKRDVNIISTINKSASPPTMIPMIAPMGRSSSDSIISGARMTVEVTTDDITDVVAIGCLEGVTMGVTMGITIYIL